MAARSPGVLYWSTMQLRMIVFACCIAGCDDAATQPPASSPATTSDPAAVVADDPPPAPAPSPAPSTTINLTIDNQSGDARFAWIARSAIGQRLASESETLRRYALVVIIQPFEVDGDDLRARLTARVSDADTGRLAGEIPVSLKLAGGAADRTGPAAEELVSRAATRAAEQVATYFSKATP
jgi:hypothetical protein